MADELFDAKPANDGDTDWFSAWLDHGTVAQRSVPIYGRPDLFAKYEDLERQRKVAEDIQESGESSIGEAGVDVIEQKMKALYDEWQASKATWYIRALSSEEIDDIRDQSGFPDDLPNNPKPEAVKAYEKAMETANTKMNAAMVSRALVRIENPKGETVKESVSPAEVEAIRAKLGDQQILRLVAAAMVAMSEDVEIPVPFSRTNSTDD